ncbi:MAG TPA: acetyl-CoA carboxylase biotin carboxyl carrier protein [Puia sp.]|jgi:acetyl-CoA carboxylase biotin carboxyl carrier protein|nr:acetyl-CoA carboxylase biotin carboxyl carrier protein [Puia sp.]
MDFKQIQELIKLINKSNIGEVTIEEKGFKITVKQKEEHIQQVIAAPFQPNQSAPIYSAPAVSASGGVSSTAANGKSKQAEPAPDNLITIKSPMIGTFYRSSAPDKPSFVNVGDETEPGKVVCIIEAMKLFNEIESEVKGKIVKVLVEDASPVEFDQPLFLVDPS